ncbi:long-chain fatty acid transport protein 2-like [Aplochiton taeniatus]
MRYLCNTRKRIFPYSLLQYDTVEDEPVRDSKGLCLKVSSGDTGLLVSKITNVSPFLGYVRDPEQTEKKILRNVFKRGDEYFNTGDLLRIDHDGFIYFQDRMGETFRWKGENVATTEVADILCMMTFIEEACVYGVKVSGHEGKIGMAAVMLRDGTQFDCAAAFVHVANNLPSYARPYVIRIQNVFELTGTFKQIKVKLVEEGFDPVNIRDPLFVRDEVKKTYTPLTVEIHDSILSGKIKL